MKCPVCDIVLSDRTGFTNIIGCQGHCWIGVDKNYKITHYKITYDICEIISSVQHKYTKFISNGMTIYQIKQYLPPERALKLRAFL